VGILSSALIPGPNSTCESLNDNIHEPDAFYADFVDTQKVTKLNVWRSKWAGN